MFDIGMIEMFVVVVLAIIVVGPKDLPKLLRSIGRTMSKIQSMGQEFRSSLRQMADEVEMEEVTRKLNMAADIPLDEGDTTPDITEPDPEPEKPKSKTKPQKKKDTKQETV